MNLMEAADTPRRSGRCHMCGYSLEGLAEVGHCPECGDAYTQETAGRLRPWPSAFAICCRLGWPVAGLLVAGLIIGSGNRTRDEGMVALGLVIGYAMVVAVAINSYFQVRSMLRHSLPHNVRTQGPVAVFRALGTTVCVIVLLLFVGFPLLFGVGCLIVLSAYEW